MAPERITVRKNAANDAEDIVFLLYHCALILGLVTIILCWSHLIYLYFRKCIEGLWSARNSPIPAKPKAQVNLAMDHIIPRQGCEVKN